MLLPVYIPATGGCLPLSDESASYDSLPKFKNTAYSNRSQFISPVGIFQKVGYAKKNQSFGWFFRLCWHSLSSWVGQRIVLPKKHSGGVFSAESGYAQKKPVFRLVLSFVLALPIFPGSHPPSIVGVHELNFCVRDGNRWTLMTINANYADGFSPSLCQMTFVI